MLKFYLVCFENQKHEINIQYDYERKTLDFKQFQAISNLFDVAEKSISIQKNLGVKN